MIDERKTLGLRRNVFFLGLVSLFNDFSAEMVYAVMPAFLTAVLGAPPVFIGFMEGFVDAFASILKIISGWFSDKIGKRKLPAVIGYALSVSTRSFLAFVGSFWSVFGLRVVDRVGKGLRDAPRDALLSESVLPEELGKSFGYQRAMDTIGAILGPLTAVALLPILNQNYRELFLIAAGLGILAVLAFIFVREVKTKEEIIPPRPVPFTFSLRNFTYEFKVFLAAIFVFGIGVMPVSLILLKSYDVGLPATMIPLMYLIYTAAFAMLAVPFGRLSDRVGERTVIVGGFGFAIFAYIVFAFTNSFAGLVTALVAFGAYSAMTDGVGRALTTKLVLPTQVATGQGFLQSAVGLSSLVGGTVGGLIWTFFGSTPAFAYGAVMMIAGLLVFIRLNGYNKNN